MVAVLAGAAGHLTTDLAGGSTNSIYDSATVKVSATTTTLPTITLNRGGSTITGKIQGMRIGEGPWLSAKTTVGKVTVR
jgi:hypothetical protein